MATPILTVARQALWRAIESHSETKDLFKSKIKYEGPTPLPIGEKVGFGKLPGITILPATMRPEWLAHRIQKWNYALDCVIHTPHWDLLKAEECVELVVKAAFQSGTNEGQIPTFIMQANCRVELMQIVIRRSRVPDKDPKARAFESVVTFNVAPRTDPYGMLPGA